MNWCFLGTLPVVSIYICYIFYILYKGQHMDFQRTCRSTYTVRVGGVRAIDAIHCKSEVDILDFQSKCIASMDASSKQMFKWKVYELHEQLQQLKSLITHLKVHYYRTEHLHKIHTPNKHCCSNEYFCVFAHSVPSSQANKGRSAKS